MKPPGATALQGLHAALFARDSMPILRLGPCGVALLCLALVLPQSSWAQADAPALTLRQSIDQSVARSCEEKGITLAARCTDAEFLRRIYLDLTGTIPTAADARGFLDNVAPNKREALVDRLLAGPEHVRHLANLVDVALMERRRDKHVPTAQWREFLRISFANNKPWDELVREILSADGTDASARPAAKFYLDRDAEPNLLTRDITRLFLGMNLECAQCHDHPIVSDYEQDHYYGILAFLNRSYVFTDKQKQVMLAEKAEGDVSYKSVFEKEALPKTTGPRLVDGPAIEEPSFEMGQEYAVAPADGVRPVPRFSRRAQLAPRLATADSAEFRRNIANRLWAMVMGRGLVEPLDMHHSANPPSHPELLALLADEIAARRFDIRSFLRELVLSETYQRSSEIPGGADDVPPESFAIARLRPLSPEQLAWSLMQATGLTDRERKALGDKLTEQSLHDRVVGNVTPFVRTFAAQPGQPDQTFQATMDQALFLANGELVRNWLAPQSGNLLDRLSALKQPGDVAEELYVSILSRRPSDPERREIEEYLKDREGNRTAALQELAWALLVSAEFRFNH